MGGLLPLRIVNINGRYIPHADSLLWASESGPAD